MVMPSSRARGKRLRQQGGAKPRIRRIYEIMSTPAGRRGKPNQTEEGPKGNALAEDACPETPFPAVTYDVSASSN